jgi:hypothetical protein
VFLLFSSTVVTADLTDGLVAYWPLNDSTNDVAGANNGKLIDAAKFVDDPERGGVLSTDGAGGHMEVPHADDIAFIDNTTLTISVWVNPSQLPRTSWSTILAKNRDVHYDNAYGLWISPSNKYHFRVGGASSDGSADAVAGWHHVAMRHDPGTTTLQGFVDGEMVYENKGASPGQLGDTELRVGAAKDHTTKNIFEAYPGLIDDLAIYNRFLSDAEIKELAAGAVIPATVEPVGRLTTSWGAVKHQ